MQTQLASQYRDTHEGDTAEGILRKCVHCGFCNATCPTYQLLGDELDGPRGRIYLIKQVLEGEPVTRDTQLHLDRCLTCRNCETTCPSGVEYGKLVDIGRRIVDHQVPRPLAERATRRLLRDGLTSPVFSPALKVGRQVRNWLPESLRNKIPAPVRTGIRTTGTHTRKMLLLEGCVQPSMMPNINQATTRVLDAMGVQVVSTPRTGCCGAIRAHTGDHEGGLNDMRRNIDAWWPFIERNDVEAIIMNASGCGVTVREYGYALAEDKNYADKARRISELTRDLSELLPEITDKLADRLHSLNGRELAVHPPCTLQHGQRLPGMIEAGLRRLGCTVKSPAESHLCCGSAGTYSVLQPELATRLRDRKLENLAQLQVPAIVSANIGCIQHLQSGTSIPVRHWIEVVDEALA